MDSRAKKTSSQLKREIASSLSTQAVTKVSAKLPAATMAQRLASMSTVQLVQTAKALATKGANGDAAAESACTSVLDAVERRVSAPMFAEILADVFA